MIIFFYGDNNFKAKQKIGELKKKFFQEVDPNEHSFNILDGATTNLTEIGQTINTGSLFTKKRLTLIENILSNKKPSFLEEFLEYLQKNNLEKSDDILVIYEPKIKSQKDKIMKTSLNGEKDSALAVKEKKLFEFLSQQKFVQEFKSLAPSELSTWIKSEVEKRGSSIKPGAIQELIKHSGNDLWSLNNEIDKLVNYKRVGDIPTEIENLDIEKICSQATDDNIFALTDALGSKNRALAFKILEDQYRLDAADEYLLAMLLRQFKIILQLKVALNNGENLNRIGPSLGLHPYVAQKSATQAQYFSLEQLKELISGLTHLDYLNKTGQTDFRTGLNLLLAKI
ncbi:DNA polymerase III subunit delta [Candidatus Falkowbacteria bacterium CG10_big_fil_rev_8_21_14_0_10_39_9]|uniref:DNA-directed DNA polymerase n=1 Tax=Candidatus Falkowbacteria bacterium CG10_big_fil_rev_8_21_14_0_10_39_9 TaxID=1974566 RepID=A0A2M6WQL6_9BACT|nr:MAG: DNA polymerase III subunit delta [Candidatus Falkowbacteria bacterium CG10_big_fil_rev_8_21_14_0_10_39_9]